MAQAPAVTFSSSTMRDLPMPASPTRFTIARRPSRTVSSVAARRRISCSRPTRGDAIEAGGGAVGGGRAEGDRGHGLLLALHHERLDGRGGEARARAIDDGGSGDDLAVGSAGHHSCGQVHRIAHHGVSAAVGWADIAREDGAGVYADLQGERLIRLDDAAQGTGHLLVVVATTDGDSGSEDDLAAVAVDVTREEGDVELIGGVLDRTHERVDGVLRGIGSGFLDQAIDAIEMDEGDERVAMLALGDVGFEMVAQDRGGDEALGAIRFDGGWRRHGVHRRGRAPKQAAAIAGIAERRRGQSRGGGFAREDLAGAGGGLHLDNTRDGGASDDELEMRLAREEEVDIAAVDADGHAKPHQAGRRLYAADFAQRTAHVDGGAAATLSVGGPGEEEEKGIAAELEQIPGLVVRGGEKLREALVEYFGHLFGADLTLAGEPLGHGGEAGDVDEDERALDGAPASAGRLALPLRKEAGKVGREVRGHMRAASGGLARTGSAALGIILDGPNPRRARTVRAQRSSG